MNKLSVLGSINMDSTFYLDILPKVGETLKSQSKAYSPGGKGLNQAISAARLGSQVSFIGAVGNDINGRKLIDTLKKEDINCDRVAVLSEESTGEAIILTENDGKNIIIVNSGANFKVIFDENDIETRNLIENCDILISQFEVPLLEIIKAFKFAKECGKITVLNPAPAKKIDEAILNYTDILIPNEVEFELLTGEEMPKNLSDIYSKAKTFFEKGVKVVIITMGGVGSLVCTEDGYEVVPAFKVEVVDTTAAGDSFLGAFTSKLDTTNITDMEYLKEAVSFANFFASKVVQKKGAMVSIPTKDEIKKFK